MGRRRIKIIPLELVPEAVEDARLNSVENIDFHTGAVEKILPDLDSGGLRPDVTVLDPPRRGCRPEVLEAVAKMGTARVVYVSCDPGTLARDLCLLAGMGYRVEEVQPVDKFPWTHHVETIILLKRRNT